MRSSKTRSRNKPNRNRSVGNVVNRVFDSSGPEGKVRGTPQQIIDKYNQLARDAQVSGDRVATENFQQHAEHYMRMLSSAQREQDQRREEQERQNRDRQIERDRDRDRSERQERDSNGGATSGPDHESAGTGPQPELHTQDNGDSALVETPENRDTAAPAAAPAPAPAPKRPRKPRTRKPVAAKAGNEGAASGKSSDASDNQDGKVDGGTTPAKRVAE